MVPGEENKHPNRALNPKDQTSKSKMWLSSRKSIPKDGDGIRGLYICSFITNIRDCTQILWNTIQISFVHNFVITGTSRHTKAMPRGLPLSPGLPMSFAPWGPFPAPRCMPWPCPIPWGQCPRRHSSGQGPMPWPYPGVIQQHCPWLRMFSPLWPVIFFIGTLWHATPCPLPRGLEHLPWDFAPLCLKNICPWNLAPSWLKVIFSRHLGQPGLRIIFPETERP